MYVCMCVMCVRGGDCPGTEGPRLGSHEGGCHVSASSRYVIRWRAQVSSIAIYGNDVTAPLNSGGINRKTKGHYSGPTSIINVIYNTVIRGGSEGADEGPTPLGRMKTGLALGEP